MKKIIAMLLALVLLSGCGGGGSKASTNKNYSFTFNDVTVVMNQEMSDDDLKALGDYSLYEAPSCAFGDLDRTYTYNSFQIDTYTLDDVQYLKSILLKDDTVEFEGLCIGATKDDVTETLGTKYEEKSGNFIYTKGSSTATIMFAGDMVTNIILDAVVKL